MNLSTEIKYQICSRCVMDTSDPDISFYEYGVCNHCRDYDIKARPIVEWANSDATRELQAIVDRIKCTGRKDDYDCLIGLSGGIDSTYVASQVKKLGLRPLAVHFDSGWNSELAVNNIENIIKGLKIDLYTFVVDWEEMRDLQLAFFKASVANCDTPTDHAFLAILYLVAAQQGIRHIVIGTNYATEFILPKAWGYSPADLTHLKAIHKQFGKRPLRQYPQLGFFRRYFYYPIVKGIRIVRILNLMPYNKKEAKDLMTNELGWRDYGGKHYESLFTRFFQAYYLPVKFGYDKRRAHLSSLIVSGQITREEALRELEQPTYTSDRLQEDKEFIAKKLGLSTEEFDRVLAQPGRMYSDFPTEEWMYKIKDVIWGGIKIIRGIKTARV
ncbi:MAG: N-acetyl sugar amidotransferase [Syntrophales bacterium]